MEKFLEVSNVKKMVEMYCTDNIGIVITPSLINDLLSMIEDAPSSLTSMENPCKNLKTDHEIVTERIKNVIDSTLEKYPLDKNNPPRPEDICPICPQTCGANTDSCFKTCEIIKNSPVKNIIIRRINETMVGDFITDLEADEIVKFIDSFLVYINEKFGVDVNLKYEDSEDFGTAINTISGNLIFGVDPRYYYPRIKNKIDSEIILPHFIPLDDIVRVYYESYKKEKTTL